MNTRSRGKWVGLQWVTGNLTIMNTSLYYIHNVTIVRRRCMVWSKNWMQDGCQKMERTDRHRDHTGRNSRSRLTSSM